MKKTNEELVKEYRRGSASALSALCDQNRGLVANIARGFRGDMEDLFQAGMIGIIDAANKFDAENGAKFSTYASYWIFSHCVSCAKEMNGVVTVTGREGRRVLNLIGRAKTYLARELGREPSIDEISKCMGIDIKIVTAVIGVKPSSLNEPMPDSTGAELSEIIPDSSPTPSDISEISSLQRAVQEFANTLSDDTEKFIFRNVLAGNMTNQEAGDHFNVTRQRINQIVVKLRPKFEEYARARGLDGA